MDYYDVEEGPSSISTKTISFSTTINLQSTNTPPTMPTVVCLNEVVGGKRICENSISLRLDGATDAQGDTITNAIYCEYLSNGSWISAGDQNECILYSDSTNLINKDITGYSRGTRFRVWGKAIDSHGLSSNCTGFIDNIYRNNIPSAITGFYPNEGVFKNNYTINWGYSNDVDGQTVKYNMWKSVNGADWINILRDSDAHSYTEDIDSQAEGTSFAYKICSTDSMADGNIHYSGIFKKNTKPTTPNMIFPNKGFYLGSVHLSWNASTDPDNKGISHYDVKINGVTIGQSNFYLVYSK